MPYALIEIRQDLIDTRHGAEALGRAGWRRPRRTCLPTTACYRAETADMALREPAFTIGIEEEYLLVDRASRDLVQRSAGRHCWSECQALLQSQVMPEFLRSQIEVGTAVCQQPAEARADLARLRRRPWPRSPARYGLAPIAASTHPFADWNQQKPHRQGALQHRWRAICRRPARRLVICGMHVHVGIEDPELRIDLMSQIAYFLPHLLALSTSSPFWHGEDTGLKSYRMAVFDELPRTGLPELFDSWGEYERHLKALVKAGLIEDGSKLWWDVRPSVRFPTLEMRITDVCTRARRRHRRWPRSIAASCACSGACGAATSAGAATPPC